MSQVSATTIIGKHIVLRDLNLTCNICGITHRNIDNTGILVKRESDFDVIRLTSANPDDMCQCLLQKLMINSHIKIYPEKALSN